MIGNALGYARRNALACVALFIALGGTATASHLVVKASDIQADAVRAKHIQQNAVREKQVHRNSLARLFGRGVLGASGQLGPVGSNLAGQALIAPIGAGPGFSFPVPRRAHVRDLYARSSGLLARPVQVRIRNNGGEPILQCEIPAGQQDCDSGQTRVLFRRGDLLSIQLFAPPHPLATGITTFQIGYRISP